MGKNILLVDNDTILAEANKQELESKGYKVTLTTTSIEALNKLDAFKPDLVITEIMLENVDSGFALCHNARKKYPELPIVILSDVVRKTGVAFGASTKEEKDWVKANEFVYKPISISSLSNIIDKYIK